MAAAAVLFLCATSQTGRIAHPSCPYCRSTHNKPGQCAARSTTRTPVRCCEAIPGAGVWGGRSEEVACWPVCPRSFAIGGRTLRRLDVTVVSDWRRANDTEAAAECKAHGKRLCTKAELRGGVCCETACPLDVAAVWSADLCASGDAGEHVAEHRRAHHFDKPGRRGGMCPLSGQPWAPVGKATEDLCGEHQARKSERCVTKAGVLVRYTAATASFFSAEYASWEDDTSFYVFRNLVNARSIVLDVGGWIGSTACWFAKVAAQVLVLEPTVSAFPKLVANLRANGATNAHPVNAALGSTNGKLFMTNRGNSMDTFVSSAAAGSVAVPVRTIEDLSAAHPFLNHATFVKIDTEGHELHIVPALATYLASVRPTLFVSLHPNALKPEQLRATEEFLIKLCPHTYGPMDRRLVPYEVYRRVVRSSGRDLLCMWAPAPSHMM